MKRFFRTLTAAALSLALLSASAFAGYYYPDKEHPAVDYADMSCFDFDEAPLTQALDELEALSHSGVLEQNTPQVRSQASLLYHQILDGYDALYTQLTLAMIRYDSDYTDAYASVAYNEYTDRLTVLYDRCLTVLQMLARSPHSDILEQDGGEDWADGLYYYEPMTDEEFSLYQRETELVTQYEQHLNGDYDVQAMGEIYLELARLRNELARMYGYDSYADYAYASLYRRDYTPREVTAVEDTVKACFPLLLAAIGSTMEEDFDALYDLPGASGEQRLNDIGAHIGLLHPELEEAFSFLREYHLYDLDYSDVKLPLGYTAELPSYGSAFIFDSPYEDFSDYVTIVHEFGHFNNSFHGTDRSLWADSIMDVSEIQSQALELLFTEYAEDLFGKLGPAFRWYEVYFIVNSVLDGYMYNEFETAVYSDPDMTVDELNRLFLSISETYGGGYEDTDWIETTHLFQSPFYYVSYGTSALSSLDIWLTSLSDRERAVDAYMTISALPTTATYAQAVKVAELRDIFDADDLTELIADLREVVADELDVSLPALKPAKQVDRSRDTLHIPFALLLRICIGAVAVVVLLAAVLLQRRRQRQLEMEDALSWKKPGRSREDPWDE